MDPAVKSKLDKRYQSLKIRVEKLQMSVAALDPGHVTPNEVDDDKQTQKELKDELSTLREDIVDQCATDGEVKVYEGSLEVLSMFLRKVRLDLEKLYPTVKGQAAAGAGIKLPSLELPKFDGRYEEWTAFKDLFTASIGHNVSLSKAQRLQYLKGSLSGEAERLIRPLPITEGNYDEAWGILNKRYENTKELIFAVIRKLFAAPAVRSESSQALQRLLDYFLEAVSSLRVLKRPVEKWDDLLVYMLVDRMDMDTKQWFGMQSDQTKMPSFADVTDFLQKRIRGLFSSGSKPHSVGASAVGERKSLHSSSPSGKCGVCGLDHPTFRCQQLTTLSVDERVSLIRSKGLCFNCLSTGHASRKCQSSLRCKTCKGAHNTIIHQERSTPIDVKPSPVLTSSNVTSAGSYAASVGVLLGTALAKAVNRCGTHDRVRVFFDNGSESSFITSKCVGRLGLRSLPAQVDIIGVGGVRTGSARGSVIITIGSYHSRFTLTVSALLVSKITGNLPSFSMARGSYKHVEGLPLADPQYFRRGEVDVLLGADVIGQLMLSGRRTGGHMEPYAMETELGWILMGRVPAVTTTSTIVNHACAGLAGQLEKFWAVEEVSTMVQAEEEHEAEAHFIRTIERDIEGRFITSLPQNGKSEGIGASRDIAMRRLSQLEKRLQRNPAHKEEYCKFMCEYENLGHMKRIPEASAGEEVGVTNYIPHHYVIKEDSSTTKLRVVFDASAKSSTGMSLNDSLMVGPVIQDSLYDILLRFRMHQVVLKADITKMFRQFKVKEDDQDRQRILWRSSTREPAQEFALTTVTYGTSCAPFVATRCLKELALKEGGKYSKAAAVLLKDFYVDDLMTGAGTVTEAVMIQTEICKLLSLAGLEIRKWDSNSPAVLSGIPPELVERNLLIKGSNDWVSKALGVVWHSPSDIFMFSEFRPKDYGTVTKRIVLSELARVFDPLGCLAPVTVRAKLIFQQLWLSFVDAEGVAQTLDWDDPLPDNLYKSWDSYIKGMELLKEIKIPRCVVGINSCRFELCGFSDASDKAYAACIYLRSISSNGDMQVRLLTAKTKVAPLKYLGTPRLELCGAFLLTKLMDCVQAAIGAPAQVGAWTDSELVLKWLSSHSRRWQTFVANRVSRIQDTLPSERWHYVPSGDNPADCASRGLSVHELKEHSLWWNGPPWLLEPVIPTFVGKGRTGTKDLEERPGRVLVSAVLAPAQAEVGILERFSSLCKLTCVMSWILRFIFNSQNPTQKKKGKLRVQELRDALYKCVTVAQASSFVEVAQLKEGVKLNGKSKIISLNPFLDGNGVLRVGGRLQNSTLLEITKHPAILPAHHHLTNLIIRNEHRTNLHAGFQLLWCSLRRQFWIVNARAVVRSIIRKCLVCKRLRAEMSHQLMGSLPTGRVTPSRPFVTCGVDFAGPYNLQTVKGRGKAQFKVYFCLFVCFFSKAIHLEAVTDLTTESFIATLKRFVARRGLPAIVHSDNGTNFVGADRELSRWLALCKNHDGVGHFLLEKGITWKFIPPSAPHMGGLWEAGVKTVKAHLKAVVGDMTLTLPEFETILAEVEAVVNSRPLCAMSPDPGCDEALTPGHFLIGQSLNAIPAPDLTQEKQNRLSRWQRTQQVVQQFWQRWSREYLTSLQQRRKWTTEKENVRIGDVVAIKDDNLPPMKWKLGRVTGVHKGADGLVRVVELKTSSGPTTRPIVKICPLVPSEE